jgi:hypothetical protein
MSTETLISTYTKLTNELEAAKVAVETKNQERQAIVRSLLEQGPGPYKIDGAEFTPVKKGNTFFFKASRKGMARPSKKKVDPDTTV